MKVLCFKLHKNHAINEEFDFFEMGGGLGDPAEKSVSRPISILNGHKMMV